MRWPFHYIKKLKGLLTVSTFNYNLPAKPVEHSITKYDQTYSNGQTKAF